MTKALRSYAPLIYILASTTGGLNTNRNINKNTPFIVSFMKKNLTLIWLKLSSGLWLCERELKWLHQIKPSFTPPLNLRWLFGCSYVIVMLKFSSKKAATRPSVFWLLPMGPCDYVVVKFLSGSFFWLEGGGGVFSNVVLTTFQMLF